MDTAFELLGLLALFAFLGVAAAATTGGGRKAPTPPPGDPAYKGPRQFRPDPPPAPPARMSR